MNSNKKQIKIAKKIVSFLKTKETNINNKIDYAKSLAQYMNVYFKNKKLKEDYVEYEINVYPYEYVQNYKNEDDFYKIKIIMFYWDKLQEKLKKFPIRKEYKQGTGQAISMDQNHQWIVIYGHSVKKEYNLIDYFKDTFIHQMIHVLDYCQDQEERDRQDFFGHPIEGIKENGGIPFPGMNGQDDDFFDELFAEYYTCKAQRREYVYQLISFIDQYAKDNKLTEKYVVNLILSFLNDKNDFKKFIKKMESYGYNYIALIFLYHLAFSKQKNGNKEEAIKILKDLF